MYIYIYFLIIYIYLWYVVLLHIGLLLVSVQCMLAMHARSRCLITSCCLFALDLPPELVEYGVATAPFTVAEVTNIIMKTTGECLSAETIEAGPARGDGGLPEYCQVNCSILVLSSSRSQCLCSSHYFAWLMSTWMKNQSDFFFQSCARCQGYVTICYQCDVGSVSPQLGSLSWPHQIQFKYNGRTRGSFQRCVCIRHHMRHNNRYHSVIHGWLTVKKV